MSECSLVGWLTFAILTATLIVVAWYTVETSRLRREAQRQTELETRPFLSLTIEGTGFERRARLVNVGRGVAAEIEVQNIIIDSSMELRRHQELTHLAPGDRAHLPLHVWVRVPGSDWVSEVPAEDHGWNIAKALDTNDVAVVVSYASLTGQRYETTIRMVEGAPRIPRIIGERRLAGTRHQGEPR